MEARQSAAPRFFLALQPSIIRIYKVAGLVALTAILIGLVAFLVSNIFYFFDHTWVKPIPLGPENQRVVEASTQLADANLRASQLDAEQLEIAAQLAEIDRAIAADEKFLAEASASDEAPKTPEQWLLKHQLELAALDKENQIGRRAPLLARRASLGKRTEEQAAVVHRLEQSPYLRAINGKIVLAFVPNQNLGNLTIGTKLYGCSWGLVACSPVGKVTATINGEVQDIHPHDESVQRGIMVEVELTTPSAGGDKVLFLGGKPLWLF